MTVHPSFRKPARTIAAAGRERTLLRLVQGPGVVPLLPPDDPSTVATRAGAGTVADLLHERGPLPEPECRAIGARVARALERVHGEGLAHGDVKPSNIVFSPDGDLWLVDFDAAAPDGSKRTRGTLQRLRHPSVVSRDDDIAAVALTVVECATGIVIDPGAAWTTAALGTLGCSPGLGADIVAVLRTRPSAGRVAALLQRRDDRLPAPPALGTGVDSTPTADLVSTAIVGLPPIGDEASAIAEPQRSRRVRSSKVSRRTTRRASPSDTNTTGGRGTLL